MTKWQRGISLVEVLAATAIGSIVTIGLLKTVELSVRGYNTIEFKGESQNLRLELIRHLSNREACRLSFAGVNPNTNSPAKTLVYNPQAQVFLDSAPSAPKSVFYNRLRVLRFGFVISPVSSYRPVSADPLRGTADVRFDLENLGALREGLREQYMTLSLSVVLDSASRIVSCVALGNDENSIWKLNGPMAYYDLGQNVGIGTDNPEFTLDVDGPIRSSNTISAARFESPLFSSEGPDGNQGFIDVFEARADVYNYTSDISLKRNIRDIRDNELSRFGLLRGKEFQWRSDQSFSLGLVAQNVESVYPQAIFSRNDGKLSIDYSQIVALLIERIKKLDERRSSLQKKIEQMESE